MILFRLLNFALKVVGSFFFVFLLQIQFSGKTLESYLNNFGKKFVVTKTLQKVGQDGAKVIKSLSSSEDNKERLRQISSSEAAKYIKDFTEKIELPKDILRKEKEEKPDSSN